MKHCYISLGAACDTAMNLKAAGLREVSYPFDWLWNLSLGMDFVSGSIRNDFLHIQKATAYKKTHHYRFGGEVVAYADYPEVAHVHFDPLNMPDEHEKLKRRISRFLNELKRESFKHFIYYRVFEEDLLSGKSHDLESSLNNLIAEGKCFVELLKEKYPDIKFNLLLIMQTTKANLALASSLFRKRIDGDDLRGYRTVITGVAILSRNDEVRILKMQWRLQWMRAILFHTRMPFRSRAGVLFHVALGASGRLVERFKGAVLMKGAASQKS